MFCGTLGIWNVKICHMVKTTITATNKEGFWGQEYLESIGLSEIKLVGLLSAFTLLIYIENLNTNLIYKL